MGYRENPYFDEIEDQRGLDQLSQEPLVCEQCKVVLENGRFVWTAREDLPPTHYLCPACVRTKAFRPGAVLELLGDFLKRHRTDILLLVSQTEEMEKKSHPLQRVISLEHSDLGVKMGTTYEHLSRKIAERVASACGGRLCFQERVGEQPLRISWSRE